MEFTALIFRAPDGVLVSNLARLKLFLYVVVRGLLVPARSLLPQTKNLLSPSQGFRLARRRIFYATQA